MNNQLTICCFGNYNANYSRNKILFNGLKANGVNIIECCSNEKGVIKYFKLFKKHWKIKNDYQIMFVPFQGQKSMIIARLITSKPIVFDAFISLFDTRISDRELFSKNSLTSRYYWLLDWLSCRLATKIILDTNQHINYFSTTFKIKPSKFARIFIGADTNIFHPTNKRLSNKFFIVHFHGNYIPLQGIEYIIQAAKLLEENEKIKFHLIGDGQLAIAMKKMATSLKIKNIDFIPKTSQEKISQYINNSHICLGIFGKTDKALRVIPNKLYECIAAKNAVITADTPAIRELFDEQDLILVKRADPESLADAIKNVYIKNKYDINKLTENSYNKFNKFATPAILGEKLKTILIENL